LSTLIDASLYAALGFFVGIVSCRSSLSTADVDIRVDKALKVQKKRIGTTVATGMPAKEAPADSCRRCGHNGRTGQAERATRISLQPLAARSSPRRIGPPCPWA
jgi:hypothetical protein